jgi:uncharacterized protein (TIGR03435 family)
MTNQENSMLSPPLSTPVLLLLSVLWLGPLSAQTAELLNPPKFETVSIRQNVSGAGMRITYTPDGYIATGISLQPTIVNAYAYRLGDVQFMTGERVIPGAPGWVTSDRYDINAKLSEADALKLQALSKEHQVTQIRLMLQAMLADRFQLKVHRETENTPGYALVASSNGSKLKPSTSSDSKSGDTRNHQSLATRGNITSVAGSMSDLVFVLVGALHAPVIDKTGLTGRYDFTLTYSPDELQPEAANVAVTPESAPSIFTVIQEQLGLKLQRTSVPTEALVIDHIEKPSEN